MSGPDEKGNYLSKNTQYLCNFVIARYQAIYARLEQALIDCRATARNDVNLVLSKCHLGQMKLTSLLI